MRWERIALTNDRPVGLAVASTLIGTRRRRRCAIFQPASPARARLPDRNVGSGPRPYGFCLARGWFGVSHRRMSTREMDGSSCRRISLYAGTYTKVSTK